MEFKLRANMVMSKSLTVEAAELGEAMEKAKELLADMPMKDFQLTDLYFDEIEPIKWLDESKYRKKQKKNQGTGSMEERRRATLK